jgi:YHS domain-containing protein
MTRLNKRVMAVVLLLVLIAGSAALVYALMPAAKGPRDHASGCCASDMNTAAKAESAPKAIDAACHEGGTCSVTDMATVAQTTCPVMGGKISKKYFSDYDGKRVYFCCDDCPGEFKKDPAKYVKKLEDAGVTLEKAPSPEGQTK